jgi:hypothetical protein
MRVCEYVSYLSFLFHIIGFVHQSNNTFGFRIINYNTGTRVVKMRFRSLLLTNRFFFLITTGTSSAQNP